MLIFWRNVKNDDIDHNTGINNCIKCIIIYQILPIDSLNTGRLRFPQLVFAKQDSVVTV